MIIEVKCQSCKGTGIYVGMAEGDRYGVVCYTCGGKGWHTYEYEERPSKLVERYDVSRVLKRNPGIKVGGGLEFGGMSYADWYEGKPFPPKSEMREFVCPNWWFGDLGWERCRENVSIGERYSQCRIYRLKGECWDIYDELSGNPGRLEE
jgi:hypothetical protein